MEDRAVVITGGGSGIGQAVALLCAEREARVAVLDLRNDEAEHTAEESLRRGAKRAIGLQCDVGIESEVESALARCRQELGGLSRIFANAGVELNGSTHEMPYETWNRVMTTNLTGVFLTCKHSLRAMVEDGEGGAIVCTSSPAAFVGFAGGGNGPYAASKGGVSALVRTLALDYAPYDIRVNAVVPGATDTPMMWAGFPAAEREAARRDVEQKAKNEIPLGRLARPEEPAQAVLWLLSDESSYVTGSHLVCDGGILAKSPNTF